MPYTYIGAAGFVAAACAIIANTMPLAPSSPCSPSCAGRTPTRARTRPRRATCVFTPRSRRSGPRRWRNQKAQRVAAYEQKHQNADRSCLRRAWSAGAARESASALNPTCIRSSCASAARTRDQYRPARSASAEAGKWRRNRQPGSSTCAINTAAMIASRSCESSAAIASSRGLSCFGTRSDSESQRPKAPSGRDVALCYRRDAERHVPLDGRREPEPVGAGPVVLELRQRRHALHHDRCDAYGCAERPYSRDAAAWTHDVALAVDVDHFCFSYGVAVLSLAEDAVRLRFD